MNREVVSLGVSVELGEWVYGSYASGVITEHGDIADCAIIEYGKYPVDIKPETIGQFIGRFDMHDSSIFYGDIVDIKQTVNGQSQFVVFYDEDEMKTGLRYLDGRKYEYSVHEIFEPCRFTGEVEIEVIGNIHEDK